MVVVRVGRNDLQVGEDMWSEIEDFGGIDSVIITDFDDVDYSFEIGEHQLDIMDDQIQSIMIEYVDGETEELI